MKTTDLRSVLKSESDKGESAEGEEERTRCGRVGEAAEDFRALPIVIVLELQ